MTPHGLDDTAETLDVYGVTAIMFGLMKTRFYIHLALLAALSLPLMSCSTTKIAVGAMGPILDNTRSAALRSGDTRTFHDGTPANLVLLEGIIETDPDDTNLRINAGMLYFSYAFTFEDEEDIDYAAMLYLRGFEHGRVALFKKNKAVAAAWEGPFEDFVASLDELDEKDMPALVWTVGNWSQYLGLNLDSTKELTQIPRAEALLERACAIDGSFFEGLPYTMLGSLHAFRPPMMGGKPEASNENFQKAFEASGRKFLLAQLLYAKFYCYRIQDAELFETTLLEVLEQPADIHPEYRLLNTIAQEKARTLLEEKDELF